MHKNYIISPIPKKTFRYTFNAFDKTFALHSHIAPSGGRHEILKNGGSFKTKGHLRAIYYFKRHDSRYYRTRIEPTIQASAQTFILLVTGWRPRRLRAAFPHAAITLLITCCSLRSIWVFYSRLNSNPDRPKTRLFSPLT